MLVGEMLILGPVSKDDLCFYLEWFNDPEIIQYTARYLPITEMEEEKWIDRLVDRKNTEVVFAIKLKQTKEIIGNCGLHKINHKDQHATFGIVIGNKDCWGKGYGTEAAKLVVEYGFNQLNLNRISSAVISFNERSLAMHRKVGFREEGRRREKYFKNGKFYDEVIFGLLRKEWRS